MTRQLLMAHRTRLGVTEAEPVVVDVTDDGRLNLELDDGVVFDLDWDEVLAVAEDTAPPVAQEAA